MLLRPLKFNIHIVYNPRYKMQVADALSRASVFVQEPSDAELQEDIEVIVHSLVQNFSASPPRLEKFHSETASDHICKLY